MRSQSVTLCVALAGLLGPFTAHSAPSTTTVGAERATRVVRFGDLSLDSRSGVTILYARIKHAAEQVCEPALFSPTDLYLRLRHCEEQAIEQAVLDVGSVQLTSFHMSKTHPVATAQAR